MHRATPINSSFRGYSAGGARTCIDQVDDSKLMQAMSGNFMKGETRSNIEAPQNYGFTSVVHDADKDQQGSVTGSAEGFVSFLGGSRSLGVCTVMDDRRHRLKGLEKGDSAMFRGKDDQQQFHMTKDGGYWSAADDKTVRMQLVPKKQQEQQEGQQQQGQQQQGSSNGQNQQQQRKKPTGQKPVYKDGQDGHLFVDVTKEKTTASGKTVHLRLDDGKTYVHAVEKEVYVGAEKGKAQFAKIMTASGPSANSYARIGSLADEDVLVVDHEERNERHGIGAAIAVGAVIVMSLLLHGAQQAQSSAPAACVAPFALLEE